MATSPPARSATFTPDACQLFWSSCPPCHSATTCASSSHTICPPGHREGRRRRPSAAPPSASSSSSLHIREEVCLSTPTMLKPSDLSYGRYIIVTRHVHPLRRQPPTTIFYGGASPIQATMPSTFKHPAHVPMWRGVEVVYLLIALCIFRVAIGGFWAYGNLMPAGGMLNALYAFHSHDIPRGLLATAFLWVVFNCLSSFQIYSMPVFDSFEAGYTSRTN